MKIHALVTIISPDLIPGSQKTR